VTKAITTGDSIPQNEGQVRPVTVVAPEGSFFNPRPPSPVAGRAILNQRIVEVAFGALAQALPESVCAASGQWVNPIFGGTEPATGRRFVFYDYITGGIGARMERDGVDAMSPAVSIEGIPVEIQEAQYPVLVERFELMTDSGGAGKARGGLSVRKDIRMLVDEVQLSCLTDRHRFAPYGLDGGRPGSLGEVIVNPGSPDERRLASKGDYVLAEGDLVSVRCSGSGGFGEPSERSPEAIREDIEELYVSPESARDDYGVRLDGPAS
jgi:N-methylhydantoinase B